LEDRIEDEHVLIQEFQIPAYRQAGEYRNLYPVK
jgi:hypothetical protein